MSRRQRHRRPRPRSRQNRATTPAADLWGRREPRPRPPEPIRPSPDPAALLRSLGSPPLAATASHQLAVVYEEAVRTATALAAANDLLAPDATD
jgi:hypothetical protein